MAEKCLLPHQIIGDRVEEHILGGLRRALDKQRPETAKCTVELPADVTGPRPCSNVTDHIILVAAEPDENTFTNFARSRLSGCFQIEADGNLDAAAGKLAGMVRHDLLFVSLNSATAYGSRLAVHLCEKLNNLFAIEEAMRVTIKSALVEALQNAIVHGNLELPSPNIQKIPDFEKFASRINERLQDDTLASRSIDVGMWKMENAFFISVTDQGCGFDLDAKDRMSDPDAMPGKQYTGRGRLIMREMSSRMWVDQGGRRTIMRFD